MFDHISIGVADISRSRAFYDAALSQLGLKRLSDAPDSVGYGRDGIGFWVLAAARPAAADLQSGLHICFSAPSRAAVDGFHTTALSAGGADNGEPGIRAHYGEGYYAAFVVDPDGFRLEAYCAEG